MSSLAELLAGDLRVVNVGLASFAEPVQAAGGTVTTLDWRPPAAGDAESALRLARLFREERIEAANATAIERVLAAQPMLVDLPLAGEAIPELAAGRLLLHAGPPIEWERMCGPMRGAIAGAIVLEGWAENVETAEKMAAAGEVDFAPAHHFDAVGPMAGVVSASMPLFVVEDAATGRRAYSTLNEGLGKVLRYGANDVEVLRRLRWMNNELGPVLKAALRSLAEPINAKSIISQALQMGDECHNRNIAATSLLARQLAPALAGQGEPGIRALEFLRDNNFFFLNLSMASCKLMLLAGHDVAGSSLVTTMARNGVEFGIRVSGTGDAWYTAPAPVPEGLYFPGYGPSDANPDLGDSAITETAGIGGFAMAAAPAIVGFVGGTFAEAMAYSVEMGTITLARNREFQLPTLGVGAATGIDVRRVLDSGSEPVINTGIAHRLPGVGQVGAGICRAPLGCFTKALAGLEAVLRAAS
ncbi:MAG: DUF1116 domain-containing protein [Candidatus Dormibacteraeota bacterium]|nr:DUF1116 domain-containing protein [Candidatus Dormibacteraeota bacterium]